MKLVRGKQYVALILVLLLVTALPYTPLQSTRSSEHVTQEEARDNPDDTFPEFDSDGDGLNDSYELMMGFDPFDMDTNGNGIPDGQEQDFWEDLSGSDEIPPWLQDMYGPEGDLDGDGIPNAEDDDIDGDGIPNDEDPDFVNPNQFSDQAPIDNFYGQNQDPTDLTQRLFTVELTHVDGIPVDDPAARTANPRYWRAAAYEEYNGAQWRISDGLGYLDEASPNPRGTYEGGEIAEGLATSKVIYTYRIDYSLYKPSGTSSFLPTALHTLYLDPETPDLNFNKINVDSEDAFWTDTDISSYSFSTEEYIFLPTRLDEAEAPDSPDVRYIHLPDMSNRTRDLADQLYNEASALHGGEASDYQLAQYINDHLSTSGTYTYSLHAAPAPQGEDSVDHFLFETQEGKCTNFASAYVVLTRLNNLPSRFVVGYALGEVENDTRYVTVGNGHAWAETYFDDFGWIGFEPTSPYASEGDAANKSTNSTGEDDVVEGNATDPGSNNTNPDTDQDGLDDDFEINLGTDPTKKDTDGDGLWDGDEVQPESLQLDSFDNEQNYITNPLSNDTDGDGLNDSSELVGREHPGDGWTYRTDPSDADSDEDGLLDGEEFQIFNLTVKVYNGENFTNRSFNNIFTLPKRYDTDGDGLSDGLELGRATRHNDTAVIWQNDTDNTTRTSPYHVDTDSDGIEDGDEDRDRDGAVDPGDWNDGLGPGETDPLNRDTDGGARSDWHEIRIDLTDPLTVPDDIDTDGDGIVDGDEDRDGDGNVTLGPWNDGEGPGETDPNKVDTDGDGMWDGWEVNNSLNPLVDDADEDPDEDGLTNLQEYLYYQGTFFPNLDPHDPDTDGDTLLDGWEWNLTVNFGDMEFDGRKYEDLFDPVRKNTDGLGKHDGADDYDGDGLSNSNEELVRGTRWNDTDTDDDTMWDGDEVRPLYLSLDGVDNPGNYESDPLTNDTDGDGLNDTHEVTGVLNPFDGAPTDPGTNDTDEDGFTDLYEMTWWWNTTDRNMSEPKEDWDQPGWSTSDPNDPDTDEDELEDGDEEEDNPLIPVEEEVEEVEFDPFGGGRGDEPTNPDLVTKDQRFTMSHGLAAEIEGLTIQTYLNKTLEQAGTRLGTAQTNATGAFTFTGLKIPNSRRAGEFILRYRLPRQTVNSTVYKETWSDAWNLTVRANTTLGVSHPDFVPAGGSVNLAGNLKDTGNLALPGARVNLTLKNSTEAVIEFTGADTIQDGSFSFTLSIDEADTYTVWLEYDGGAYLNGSAANGSFQAIVAHLNFTAQLPAELEAGQTFTVNGTLEANTTGSDLQGNLILALVGSSPNLFVQGVDTPTSPHNFSFNATLPATVQAGNRTLRLEFVSFNTAFHPSSSILETVFITAPSFVTIEVDPTLSTRNTTLSISGRIHDNQATQEGLAGTLELLLRDEHLAWVETADGNYSVELPVDWSEPLGPASLRVLFNGTDVYHAANATTQFTLEAETSIDLPDAEVIRGEYFVIRGYLTDDNSMPLNDQNITLLLDGETLYEGLITNPQGRFDYSHLWNHTWSEPRLIEARYEGSDHYRPTSTVATYTPLTATVLSLTNLSRQRTVGNLTMEGELLDVFGGRLADRNVTIELNWTGAGPAGEGREPGNLSLPSSLQATTDVNGTFQFNLTIDPAHPVGNYTLLATFLRQGSLLGSTAPGQLTLKGKSRVQVLEDDWPILVQGAEYNIVGHLTDDLNHTLADRQVRLFYDTQAIANATTDGQGRFNFSSRVADNANGLHDLTVKFDGDALHPDSASLTRELVIREPTQLAIQGLPSAAQFNTTWQVTIRLTKGVVPELYYGTANIDLTIYRQAEAGSGLADINDTISRPIEDGIYIYELELWPKYPVVSVQASYDGDETHFASHAVKTVTAVAAPPEEESFLEKWLYLLLGLPVAFLVTIYYIWWSQRHKYEVIELLRQMRRDMNETDDYRRIIIQAYHQFCTILERYQFMRQPAHTAREFKKVVLRALPLEPENVELLTDVFEIARYSETSDQMVDEMGMKWADGSYQIWCQESLDRLVAIENDLTEKLKRTLSGKVITRMGKGRVDT